MLYKCFVFTGIQVATTQHTRDIAQYVGTKLVHRSTRGQYILLPCITKRNEWGFRPLLCTNRLNFVSMVKWHCPPDTGFEIWALVVWGQARYLSVTEVPQNIEYLQVRRGKNIFFLWNLKARVGFEPASSDFPSRQETALTFNPLPLHNECIFRICCRHDNWLLSRFCDVFRRVIFHFLSSGADGMIHY